MQLFWWAVALCSGVSARDMQNILLRFVIGVILERRKYILPEIWSISKWKCSGNYFKMNELEFLTENLSVKKKGFFS